MTAGSTRERLLAALTRGPRTAQELAREFGVDTAAARRHLDGFLEDGLAVAVFRQEGLGRPKKYYEITIAGREALPRAYDRLLLLTAGAVARREGDAGLARLMDAVAEDLAATYAGRIPRDAPLRERVRALAGVLRELGFPTEVEERAGRLVLVRRDCIFLQLAQKHKDAVCGNLDTGFLTRLLGDDVDLLACLPAGDATCRHEVRLPGR